MKKLKKLYEQLKAEAKKRKIPFKNKYFFNYLFIRMKIYVSVENYFENHLWKKNNKFYNQLKQEDHLWKNISKKMMPNASKHWLFIHKIDYLFSKIIYPGLDARDYFIYEFYNFRREKRKEFITEGALAKMDKHFNGGEDRAKYREILENKALFNKKFSSFIKREWIDMNQASYNDFLSFCKDKDSVIVKPLKGVKGIGIYIALVDTENKIKDLYEKIKQQDYIVEEILKQCDDLNKLNSSCINTVRIYSVMYKNKPYITGGVLRVGRGDKPVDNYSVGGLAASIDINTGVVKSHAVCSDQQKYLTHPKSNISIIGFKIPEWENILKTVKSAHLLLPQLRYIGWDVVVCKDLSITFLEANTFGGVELQQQGSLEGKKYVYKKYWD